MQRRHFCTLFGSLWLSCCAVLSGCAPQPTTPAVPAPSETTPAAPSLEPASAPVVELDLVDHLEYDRRIASFRGQYVLVDFWATWCAPCKVLFPHTQKLADVLGPQGLVVVTVSVDQIASDENEAQYRERVLTFLREQQAVTRNWAVPVRELPPGEASADDLVAERFDIDGGAVPHYKLYDREGQLIRKFFTDLETGESPDAEEIELELRKLLARRQPEAR